MATPEGLPDLTPSTVIVPRPGLAPPLPFWPGIPSVVSPLFLLSGPHSLISFLLYLSRVRILVSPVSERLACELRPVGKWGRGFFCGSYHQSWWAGPSSTRDD